MALKATIYKATVNVADLDRNQFLDASLTLARHPSETQERMMLRLLAWLKYADERLQFTRGLCADDEPEAWLRNDHLGIDLWIELGLPDERRIKKACTLCTQDSQKACQGRICGSSPRRRRWLSPVGRAQPGHSLRPDDRYGRGFPPKQLYGSHLFLSLAGQPWRLYGSLPSDRHSGKAECGTEGPHFGGHFGSGRLIFSPTNWTNFIHF